MGRTLRTAVRRSSRGGGNPRRGSESFLWKGYGCSQERRRYPLRPQHGHFHYELPALAPVCQARKSSTYLTRRLATAGIQLAKVMMAFTRIIQRCTRVKFTLFPLHISRFVLLLLRQRRGAAATTWAPRWCPGRCPWRRDAEEQRPRQIC